ncbi:hypothetical protein HDU79_009496, partial [Rhizoclosmatium sp. JEL0117]
MNGTYIPPQCKSPTSKCIEMWHYDPGYATGIFQRVVDGLKLPVTINFLGFGGETYFQEAINNRRAVFIMSFTPTTFIANNNLTKVLFPNSNPNQYAAFAK